MKTEKSLRIHSHNAQQFLLMLTLGAIVIEVTYLGWIHNGTRMKISQQKLLELIRQVIGRYRGKYDWPKKVENEATKNISGEN